MNDDLLNIFRGSQKDIDNNRLMDYLNGRLSAADKHEFEKTLIDSDLMNDAVEGLEKFKDQKDLAVFVQQINSNLSKQIEKNKTKKQKRRFRDMPWLYITVVLIIFIILIGFLVIWKHLNP